jgi:hypothetical protein
VQSSLNGFDTLLRMCCCHCRNADCLQSLVLQHIVVVRVDFDAPWFQVLFCPCKLILSRCECRYELGFGRAVEEVVGMTSAHPSQARDGDLESAKRWGHDGGVQLGMEVVKEIGVVEEGTRF